jgi:hypothetical protein
MGPGATFPPARPRQVSAPTQCSVRGGFRAAGAGFEVVGHDPVLDAGRGQNLHGDDAPAPGQRVLKMLEDARLQ